MLSLIALVVGCQQSQPDASATGQVVRPAAGPIHAPTPAEDQGPGWTQALDGLPALASLPRPIEEVDVLVIGAGAAGLAAAWEAREAGATVLVLEASGAAGGNGRYAGNFFAVGTELQAAAGVSDTVELALSEWEEITDGGDPTDASVIDFVERSAETLDWLDDRFGVRAARLSADYGVGSVFRIHAVSITGTDDPPVLGLVEALADVTRLDTPASALVLDRGRVVGASLAGADDAWIRAGATVVSTGGFARSVERLLADRPELGRTGYLPEMGPTASGEGHPLLEAIGAKFQNQGRYGVYVHAIEDLREGMDGEALWPRNLASTIIVDKEGTRVGDELLTQGFRLYDRMLASPDQRLYALWPESLFGSAILAVPAYNWADPEVGETVQMSEAVDAGHAHAYDSVETLLAEGGFDPEVLSATLARYDALVVAGEDADHGKAAEYLIPFGAGPVGVSELVAGAAKAFTGVRTDVETRVLYPDGSLVPGLYAAGEVAGMLGTDAMGGGLSGTITACYHRGRIAGQQAAAFAASHADVVDSRWRGLR